MGFMASAFAGGLAKGFLAGKQRRAEDARYEREFNQRQEQIDNQLKIAKLNSQVTGNEQTIEEQKIATQSGLVNAGNGLFTTNARNHQIGYFHPDEVKDGTKTDKEATAYKRFTHFNSIYNSDTVEGKNLRKAYKENVDGYNAYLTELYDAMSTIREPDQDADSNTLFRMHMIRLSPMSGESLDSIRDRETYGRLLKDISDVGNGVSLEDYIKNRNMNQLNLAMKKQDGNYAYKLINKNGIETYELYKMNNINDGVPVSTDESKTISQLGYLDLSNPTQSQKDFITSLKLSQSLQDAGTEDEIVKTVASLLYDQKDNLNLGHLFDMGKNITSRDDFVKHLIQKTEGILDIVSPSKEIGGGKIKNLTEREAIAESAVLAFFIDKVAPVSYTLQRSGGEFLFQRVKVDNPLKKEDISAATRSIDTADQGIGSIEDILTRSLSIKDEFLQSGQAYSEIFDVGFRAVDAVKKGLAFFSGENNLANDLTQNEQKFLISQVQSDMGFAENEMLKLQQDGTLNVPKMQSYLTDVNKLYNNNINQILRQKQRGSFLAAAEGNESEAERIFRTRMEIESIKVRLAFQLASLVQGGGTGGGRTISNADFEVIYKSLYKGGTGDILKSNLLLVRHELSKARFRARMKQQYGKLGRHEQMSRIGVAFLDASFNRATGRNIEEYSSSDDINTRLGSDSDAAIEKAKRKEGMGLGVSALQAVNPDFVNAFNFDQDSLNNIAKYGIVTTDLNNFDAETQRQYLKDLRSTFIVPIIKKIKEDDPNFFDIRGTNQTRKMDENIIILTEAISDVLVREPNAGNSAGFGLDPQMVSSLMQTRDTIDLINKTYSTLTQSE
jgi:hypothetical protein